MRGSRCASAAEVQLEAAASATALSGESALCANGLCKRFGGVQAVLDVSFDIPRGSLLAIIGPNGAGKSTLLNLMSGLSQPDAGRIMFGGIDVVGMPAHKRARLGLARTFQKIRVFRRLSVLDNVVAAFHLHHDLPMWQHVIHTAAFARDHARCREKAMTLLAFVGLEERASGAAGSLAYGEQRMLELARALAISPSLLMVDEPAAGLNPAEVERLIERIRLLRQRGMTIVMVEHNMELVMQIADRALVMHHGQQLCEGSPGEVQGNEAVIAAYLGT